MESDALEPFLIAQHFPGLFWGMAIGYGLHCLALIVCLTYLIRSKLYIFAKCQQSSFFSSWEECAEEAQKRNKRSEAEGEETQL